MRTVVTMPSQALAGQATVLVSSLLVVGSFFWVPLVFIYLMRKCQTWKSRLAVVTFFALLVFVPVKSRRSLRHGYLWDKWHEYFDTRFVHEVAEGLAKDRAHILAMIPHGIYPFGAALALVGKGDNVFHDARPVVADAALGVPIFGHLLQWMGAVPATPRAISQALRQGMNLAMPTGGIAEMFHAGKGMEYALLSRRKGFVRLAIQEGTPLVPVYCFGNSMLLRLINIPFLEWLSRILRISLTPFTGRFGLPVPFRVPLLYAIGKPIEVIQNRTPSKAEIDAVHKTFVAALVALFEKQKHSYGWRDRLLKII